MKMIRNAYIQGECRKLNSVGLKALTPEMVDRFSEEQIRMEKVRYSLMRYISSLLGAVDISDSVEEFNSHTDTYRNLFYQELFDYEEWQYES